MLGYFEDTLANVGLRKSWLEWNYNCVTMIENQDAKRESNLTKFFSLIKPEEQFSLIKPKK